MKVLNVLTVIYLHTLFFLLVYIYRDIYGKEAVHFSTLLLLNDRSQVLKLRSGKHSFNESLCRTNVTFLGEHAHTVFLILHALTLISTLD